MDYARSAATAKRLIERDGRTVNIYRKQTTPADASKPWRGPAAPADILVASVKGVVYPFESKDVDGTIIRLTDSRIMIAHDSLVGVTDFEVLDWVEDSGVYYKIEHVAVIGPGDTRIAYDIKIRR
jgi:hypothetical protein